MIVVDTNVLVYLTLPEHFSPAAENLLKFDPEWAAPRIWKSEFCNVLAGYLRRRLLNYGQLVRALEYAEVTISKREYSSKFSDVLSLVARSNCSAYDCEFVSLAINLGVELVTMDKKILCEFPTVARSLAEFSG